MLFKLLLANITILLCFFFLPCLVFNNVFTIPVAIENARLKLALDIPTGAPVTNKVIDIAPLVADKTNKDLSKSQKTQYIY